MTPLKHVLISRTDSIGDVVLTLPMAKALKNGFPGVRVSFLGKSYTRPVIESCVYVDQFVDEADFKAAPQAPFDTVIHVLPKPELARQAKALHIPVRIGTTNRLYHWWTCNKLVRLSRKNSELHEAQLNLKLLAPLGLPTDYSLSTLSAMVGLQADASLPDWTAAIFTPGKKVVILHPKSQGSAREWPLDHFKNLTTRLLREDFTVVLSGTAAEKPFLEPLLQAFGPQLQDAVGKLNLTEFMRLICQADGLVAASTGPLHLAGALGTAAVGIYPAERPMHAGRWAPLGPFATSLSAPPQASPASNPLAAVSTDAVFEALRQQLDVRGQAKTTKE